MKFVICELSLNPCWVDQKCQRFTKLLGTALFLCVCVYLCTENNLEIKDKLSFFLQTSGIHDFLSCIIWCRIRSVYCSGDYLIWWSSIYYISFPVLQVTEFFPWDIEWGCKQKNKLLVLQVLCQGKADKCKFYYMILTALRKKKSLLINTVKISLSVKKNWKVNWHSATWV